MPGKTRVIRGGSWNNNPANVRAANRNRNSADNRNTNMGFRLCLPAIRKDRVEKPFAGQCILLFPANRNKQWAKRCRAGRPWLEGSAAYFYNDIGPAFQNFMRKEKDQKKHITKNG